jgi:hypothetical protein
VPLDVLKVDAGAHEDHLVLLERLFVPDDGREKTCAVKVVLTGSDGQRAVGENNIFIGAFYLQPFWSALPAPGFRSPFQIST